MGLIDFISRVRLHDVTNLTYYIHFYFFISLEYNPSKALSNNNFNNSVSILQTTYYIYYPLGVKNGFKGFFIMYI